MHQLNCGRPCGGREGQSCVAQIVQSKIRSPHIVSGALPRSLQDVRRPGDSRNPDEDERIWFGSGVHGPCDSRSP